MGDYTEHLISMAGGDGDAVDNIAAKSWDAIIDGAAPWAEQDEETVRIHTETVRAVIDAMAPEDMDAYMRANASTRAALEPRL